MISKKFEVKHPALRVSPGGNQVDGLPPAAILRRGCAIFIRIFIPVKTYKPKNPSGWHYLLDELSPEMDSNPNLHG